MKPLSASDFRAARLMLADSDFALVSLPDDVSIRTSDTYGPQLEQMWEYWSIWGRVVLAVHALTKNPTESPTATAACDAADEFQAATYCALVGYYRVAFSCLRSVLEQMTVATRLALIPDPKQFAEWRNASEKIGIGWAADTIVKNTGVRAVEKHLAHAISDSLFVQAPKGFVRRLFAELSKYTHGSAGFTDADFRQSNGPIFVAETFLAWCVATLKTYIIVLHEVKLAHPELKDLPYGPPPMAFDKFRQKVMADIPSTDRDQATLQALVNYWP
jgi:hypothetical protein